VGVEGWRLEKESNIAFAETHFGAMSVSKSPKLTKYAGSVIRI